MPKHGHPKGAEPTVIGLPCKWKKVGKDSLKPVPFIKKQPKEKDQGIDVSL